jgi:HSP20 family protein
MSQVAINKCSDSEALSQELQNAGRITDLIRERAFNLFQHRGGAYSSDLDDWLQAERDVVWSPPSELVDEGRAFSASLAVPGFDAEDIQLCALPDAIIVEADSSHSHEGKAGDICFREFSDKQLFRRMNLPGRIDVDHVSASIDKGILHITAPKARPTAIAASR